MVLLVGTKKTHQKTKKQTKTKKKKTKEREKTERKKKEEGRMPTNRNQTGVNQMLGDGEVTIFLAYCPASQKCSSKKVIYVASLVEAMTGGNILQNPVRNSNWLLI